MVRFGTPWAEKTDKYVGPYRKKLYLSLVKVKDISLCTHHWGKTIITKIISLQGWQRRGTEETILNTEGHMDIDILLLSWEAAFF